MLRLNKPASPSGFPRSLAIWKLDINELSELGNPLGGAGMFNLINLVPN